MMSTYTYDRRSAAVVRLDLAWVDRLRKDFLTLLKNLPLVQDYDTALELRKAFETYRNRFVELVIERFLKGTSPPGSELLKQSAHEFEFSLLACPITVPDHSWNQTIRGMHFARFQKEFPAWKRKAQTKGAAFWKAMKATLSSLGHSETGINVTVPAVENATVEGFKLVMSGYVHGNPEHSDLLQTLSAGLRLYRKRAAAVAPILLKKQLPIECDFGVTLDQGGEYHVDHIMFYVSSVSRKGPSWVAHTIAHEMGHCLWRTTLSGAAQTFWYQTIKGDYGDLDLKELLDKWPESNAWAFDFPRYIGKSDPILALQVQAIGTDDLQSKEQFQALYDSGRRSLRVPKTPITGYANKNPEEAFCETLALLIAHGPAAVHERVRWWLGITLPGAIRTAGRRPLLPA